MLRAAPSDAATQRSGDRSPTQATVSHHDPSRTGVVTAQNRLNQRFEVGATNRAWVGDITFIATAAGWLYLAVLVDLYSRKVTGWAMRERIDQQLVIDALNMAILRSKLDYLSTVDYERSRVELNLLSVKSGVAQIFSFSF